LPSGEKIVSWVCGEHAVVSLSGVGGIAEGWESGLEALGGIELN